VTARALILDFDGTVVDSHAYTFAAIRHACAPWGVVPSDAAIHARFGPSESTILAAFVPGAAVDAAYARLQAFYRDQAHAVGVHPEMRPLLAAARRAGWRLALFTGRGADSTQLLLGALRLDAVYDAVVAGDSGLRPKPAPDGIEALLQQLACRPEAALVVGDSPLDIQAARAAGVQAVFAGWFRLALVAVPPGTAVAATPAELRRTLGLPEITAPGS
jgi:HAD superfamily hydrolase (TIGR01509 family)